MDWITVLKIAGLVVIAPSLMDLGDWISDKLFR